MITTRTGPRTRRLLVAAFALSILIHIFGGALWAQATHAIANIMRRLPEQHQPEREVATSDAIRLEKRTVPRPTQASRERPLTRPVPRARPPAEQIAAVRPVPAPAAAAKPEIAHHAPHAPPQPAKPEPAKAPKSATREPAAKNSALSPGQLAQLNAQFSKTIAAAHVDLATITKRSLARPVAVKHYRLQFAGLQANLQRGQGYIEPTTVGRRVGATVWYFTHYTYMWPDGHIEDDDIPWPFRFPVTHDLFAQHVHLIPLQLPPAGFHLTRPLKPFLAHFLASAGHGE